MEGTPSTRHFIPHIGQPDSHHQNGLDCWSFSEVLQLIFQMWGSSSFGTTFKPPFGCFPDFWWSLTLYWTGSKVSPRVTPTMKISHSCAPSFFQNLYPPLACVLAGSLGFLLLGYQRIFPFNSYTKPLLTWHEPASPFPTQMLVSRMESLPHLLRHSSLVLGAMSSSFRTRRLPVPAGYNILSYRSKATE